MKTKDVTLTKEECEIIWDALVEAGEDTTTVWRDPNMRDKIQTLAERFNCIISSMELK